MKLITSTMKLSDVIHSNYLLIPVLNRFGIRLGFGERSVKQVCKEHGVDPEFFLTILNAYSNENYFPQKTLQTFNVLTIVKYLVKTHSYYLETEIPIIEKQINALMNRSPKRNTSLKLVKTFFLQYKQELMAHLKREETLTYPYIRQIYRLYHAKGPGAKTKLPSGYSMKIYEEEHDNVDEKLYDLKNILIKYVKGEYDEAICNAIIFELFRLEKDIQDHTRIEDNILRPLVADMESALRRRGA